MRNDAHVTDSLRSMISSSKSATYVEGRYQSRVTSEVNFMNGELERIRVVETTGCGIRALVDGCWGFSSTSNVSDAALKESLREAISAAHILSEIKKNKVKGLAQSKMVTGSFRTAPNRKNNNLSDIGIEQKVQVAREGEKAARSNRAVKTASCIYRDMLDHKVIVNSDGANIEIYDSKPEFSVTAIANKAGGTIIVDDEGVAAGRTAIIEKGILKSFLHNRESAMIYGTASTGSARAFQYSDEPLIRMRNTYIEPGGDKLADMIKETRHGYIIKGARNGQADANGEFMFGAEEVFLIERGEVKELLRGASISGNAFEVLQSIDMVGNEFQYDIGTGYCGKYQPAKVDGGGPYIRCTAMIGGLQQQ